MASARTNWHAAFMYLARANIVHWQCKSEEEFQKIITRYRKEFRYGMRCLAKRPKLSGKKGEN